VRRLQDELGVAAELEFAYKFTYQARYGESGVLQHPENILAVMKDGRFHKLPPSPDAARWPLAA
jgi:hypothetical protein